MRDTDSGGMPAGVADLQHGLLLLPRQAAGDLAAGRVLPARAALRGGMSRKNCPPSLSVESELIAREVIGVAEVCAFLQEGGLEAQLPTDFQCRRAQGRILSS
jgi:hypothetical protein